MAQFESGGGFLMDFNGKPVSQNAVMKLMLTARSFTMDMPDAGMLRSIVDTLLSAATGFSIAPVRGHMDVSSYVKTYMTHCGRVVWGDEGSVYAPQVVAEAAYVCCVFEASVPYQGLTMCLTMSRFGAPPTRA